MPSLASDQLAIYPKREYYGRTPIKSERTMNNVHLFKDAEKNAKNIARIFGVTKPPFNLNLIFYHYKNITLELKDLKNSLFGYNYTRYDGKQVIVINENLTYREKRAVLLHEFAHI